MADATAHPYRTSRALRFRSWFFRSSLAVLALAVIAAVPALAQGGQAQQQDQATPPAAGAWEGDIEIPGSPLGVRVTLAPEGDGWTGTIDIPAQGAMGAPLGPVTVSGEEVEFVIAGVPGEPTFSGRVENDTLSGTFSQGGQAFPFTLTRAEDAGDAGVAGEGGEGGDAPRAAGGASERGDAREYVDPQGRFSLQVPTNWTASERDGFVRVEGPEGGIRVDVFVSEEGDAESAVEEGWRLSAPDVSLEPFQTLEPPSDPGVERTLIMNYDVGDPNEIYQAVAQLVDGRTYVLLVYGELGMLQRRASQLQIVASSFEITALEAADLTGAEARPAASVVADLEGFITSTMESFGIPGATIAIVQGGEIVYVAGFGVTEAGGGEAVTADTRMMIGSVGKTMTSMLVASLVDDGIIDWDTPVVDVLPRFAVADEELTQQITFRNLLCACTGVPRRDIELVFNYGDLTAEAVIESLRQFEFFTDFGEAFQYSNQLVATAGYAAAAAAGAPYGDLQDGYRNVLTERVLAPIGMQGTTLDLGAVLATGDHAMPHQLSLESGAYEPIDLEYEELVTPVEPAGAHWSTADDMARYLLTLLDEGAAADGTRVVSAENLLVTWEPQVPISATASYGLGWIVDEYRGVPMLSHGGNTLGFTSDLVFLPSADLGVVVLANAQGANYFTGAVATRLLELVYDQPAQVPAQIDFQLQQMEQALADQGDQIVDRVPLTDALTYIGAYSNPALGAVSLRIEDGQLMLDAGEWRMQVRPYLDREGEFDSYVTYGAPLTGLTLQLEQDEGGAPSLVLGDGIVTYTFDRVR